LTFVIERCRRAAYKGAYAMHCEKLVHLGTGDGFKKQEELLDAVLSHLANHSHHRDLISPVLPRGRTEMFDQLNWETDVERQRRNGFQSAEAEGDGRLPGKCRW